MINNPTIKPTGDPQTTRAVQLMFAGSRCVGVFAEEIEAVADWRAPTALPDAPASVLGIVSIRGRMLTVLDIAALVGESSASVPGKVVRLRGDEQLALAVDRVGEVIEMGPDEIPVTSETTTPRPLILGVLSKGEQPIAVLDHNQLFATAMRGRERRRRQF